MSFQKQNDFIQSNKIDRYREKQTVSFPKWKKNETENSNSFFHMQSRLATCTVLEVSEKYFN